MLPLMLRSASDSEKGLALQFRRVFRHARKRMPAPLALPRAERFPRYKAFLDLEDAIQRRHHQRGASGLFLCRLRARALDVLIQHIFADALATFTAQHGPPPSAVALLATGGYGRGELNPFSDIDLLFVYPDRSPPDKIKPFQAFLSEEILYPLWDLRLKVGHATRTPRESILEARQEMKSKNATLDARCLCGDLPLFDSFRRQFRHFVLRDEPETYIRQRFEDVIIRHGRYGDTPFIQEPEIKNGVGGLRDFHNILWMANIRCGVSDLQELRSRDYLKESEHRAILRAYDFLLRVRNELHYQSGRASDLLTLDHQPAVAFGLGYRQEDFFARVEAFMRDYYSHARSLHRVGQRLQRRLRRVLLPGREPISFRSVLESRRAAGAREFDGLVLRDKVFFPSRPSIFEQDPERLLRLFRHMQQFDVELSPELADLVESSLHLLQEDVLASPTANRSFLSVLQGEGAVYPILAEMHELGVLGKFIPPFRQITCLVQHEHYHRYTTDIHVLNTIRELDLIHQGSDPEHLRYREIIRATANPSLLYLMLLVHDLGKADGIRNHAETGLEIAGPLLHRFDLTAAEREQILFIVGHHLEMARFWQKFDIDDPRTPQLFARQMEDPDRLRYLLVHTYCDARGTSATLWNSYKDTLHFDLFHRTLEILEPASPAPLTRKARQMGIYEEVKKRHLPGISPDEMEAHFSLLPERYFLHHSADDVVLHLQMVHQLLTRIFEADSVGALIPVIDWKNDSDQGLTVVHVVTWDRPGLFYRLAGAFSIAGINILSTKAVSRTDHITIDTFYVAEPEGGIVTSARARELFEHHVEEALLHNRNLLPEIQVQARRQRRLRANDAERMRASIPPQIEIYHEISLKRTILEIQARDQIGLLYQTARAIFECGFDITFARISTERGVAMDTFYLEPISPDPQRDQDNLLNLRERILAILQPESAASSLKTGA